MRIVLNAVASLERATSSQIAEHCGITVAQACYALNIWRKFKKVRVIDRPKTESGHRIMIWGMA